MKKILVIGSLNMDFSIGVSHAPKAGETLLARSFCLNCGGKGANQAYAAAKLGGDVTMLGAVGADSYGDKLCENLQGAGAQTAHIRRLQNAPTGMAMITVDDGGENSIVVVPGANSLVSRADLDQSREAIAQCDIVICQLEIPVDTVLYAAQTAKALGKTVILDPAPAVGDLPDALFACVDIIKPNETEAGVLLGNPCAAPEEAVAALRARGVKNVLITLGKDGALLGTRDGGVVRIPALRVKAVDTTAAGDGFTAGLAVALARGESLEDAVRFATRVAAVIVTRPGAQASMPTLAEVEQAFPA